MKIFEFSNQFQIQGLLSLITKHEAQNMREIKCCWHVSNEADVLSVGIFELAMLRNSFLIALLTEPYL